MTNNDEVVISKLIRNEEKLNSFERLLQLQDEKNEKKFIDQDNKINKIQEKYIPEILAWQNKAIGIVIALSALSNILYSWLNELLSSFHK